MVTTVPSRTPRRIPWIHDALFQDRHRSRHGMTLRLDAGQLAARFRVRLRRCAGRRVAGARPRQPDRRAHRLQRGLRAAVRDRQDRPGGGPPASGLHHPAAVHLREPGTDHGRRRVPRAAATARGWTKYPLGVLWALQQRGLHVRRPGPAAGLRRSARRRAVLLPRDRMRRHHRAQRARRGGPGCPGHGPGHPARGERLRRRPHRHHGPVSVPARGGRACPLPRLPRPGRPAGAVRRRQRRAGDCW